MNTRFTHLSRGLRRQRGDMNKGESEYAAYLETQRLAGEIHGYWFEPGTLRLSHPDSGQPAKVTPDFLVLGHDGTTYWDDVKTRSGFDDKASVVRLKCAAELYPLWVFRLVRPRLKREGGGFEIKEV